MTFVVIVLALEVACDLWMLLDLTNEFSNHIEKDLITKGWRCFEGDEQK